MNVIVFGATGTVGKLTVEQLLDAGHKVTAFARHLEKLAIEHGDLTLAAGDALSADDVMAALPGHDAVVVTLGAGMSRKSVIRSEGTMNVINAMHAHGIRRLICQSTLGTGDTWRNLNFFWKRIMFGLLCARSSPIMSCRKSWYAPAGSTGPLCARARSSMVRPQVASGKTFQHQPAISP